MWRFWTRLPAIRLAGQRRDRGLSFEHSRWRRRRTAGLTRPGRHVKVSLLQLLQQAPRRGRRQPVVLCPQQGYFPVTRLNRRV